MSMSKKIESDYNPRTYDVYIGKLPKYIKEEEIKSTFNKFGEIINILRRFEKGEYGYGIVKFKYKNDADKVVGEVKEINISGHVVEVKSAKRNDHSTDNMSKFWPSCILPNEAQDPFSLRNACPENPYHYLKGATYSPHVILPPEPVCPTQPTMTEVFCTSVENAITFFGCPVFRFDELKCFTVKINSMCSTFPRLGKKPLMKGVYAALYDEDKTWYRCVIIYSTIPSKPGKCRVFYIDFGNQEEISYDNIVLLPDVMQKIPPMAVKCVLTNLVCELPKGSSNVTYLHHLANQRMSLYAIYNPTIPEYEVFKCSCNGIDVISEIIKKGFASYKRPSGNSRFQGNSCSSIKSKPFTLNVNFNDSQVSTLTNGIKSNGIKTFDAKEIKSNNVSPNKKNARNKETKLLFENKTKGLNKEVKSLKVSKKNDHQSEYVPKKIIKRGSELSEVLGNQPYNITYNAPEKSSLVKVDSVMSSLKLTNNIRDLISLSGDDSVINDAVELLVSELKLIESAEESKDNILEDEAKNYSDVLNAIRKCTSENFLIDLKSQKNERRAVFFTKLKEYIENFDISILDRRNSMQKLITDLESNSNAWMNVYLDKMPSTVDELLLEYKKVKEEKKNYIQKARQHTNDTHKCFMDCLNAFQQEFHLHNSEESEVFQPIIQKSTTKENWSKKIEEALSELNKALEAEIESCALSKGKGNVSVIQCILDKLDVPKEKLDAECSKYEKYLDVYKNLSNLPDLNTIFSELSIVQEKIAALNNRLIDSMFVDQKTAYEVYNQYTYDKEKSSILQLLHQELCDEDNLMAQITSAYDTHFPEMNIEHPELNLKECSFSKNLLKNNWKPIWFMCEKICTEFDFSYHSNFLTEPVTIQEYLLTNGAKQNLLEKAVSWNLIKSDFLVKINALFHKDTETMCAVIPCVWNALLDMPCISVPSDGSRACQILRAVLKGLRDIHSQGVIHGALHPLSILFKDGKVLLNFCFGTSMKEKSLIKGLNFQPAICEEENEFNDMYSFGCLVLWLLFPNLSFTSTDKGTPNITAFRSIVEEMLSQTDYFLLTALVDADPNLRPSASKLLNCGFLNDCESFCKQTALFNNSKSLTSA